MPVNLDDLELALEFASCEHISDDAAYLNRETGQIYYDADASDEALPDDLFENEKYIQIPSKRDLDLGRALVMAYANQYLPADIETVLAIFSKKGAYSRYKSLLEQRGLLEGWYQYEQAALQQALIEWCRENGITVAADAGH